MQYLVKAISGNDAIVSLSVDALDEAAAANYAKSQGYSVLNVSRRASWRLAGSTRAGKFSTLQFSQELLALLSAGLSLVEALQALQKRKRQGEGVIEGILAALSEGQALSGAISRFPQHFSPLYVASIQTSERTGDLQEALGRFIDYQSEMDRLRKRVISACMYPALLTGVGALVILFLLFYVVPRFSRVYQGFGGELPFFSQVLVAMGDFTSEYGSLIGLALFALAFAAAVLLNSPAVRHRIGSRLRNLPGIAENLYLYELTRLYRTLGMLLKAGVPITRASRMATALLAEDTREKLERANKLISEGRGIASAMEEASLTTPIAAGMLAVGERTGDMGRIMERVAQFHEEELSRWIEDFSRLFEPLLMLALGLAVGTVVVLMYMPIFELATIIQ
jgi:general secretion pathway protein F